MVVCSRCKAENDDHRLRCGSCGNSLSKRGDYRGQQGPNVVVLGSVEDLKRAREAGEIDSSEDDPTALGWLESGEVDEAPMAKAEAPPQTRRVSVREIDKISGLRDLRELQAALLKEGETPGQPTKQVVGESKRIERSRSRPAPEPAAEAGHGPHGAEAHGGHGADAHGGHGAEAKAPGKGTSRFRQDKVLADKASEARAPEAKPEPKPAAAPPPEPEPDAGPVLAYLSNELFPEPIPLTLGRKYLMGRDPKASIFLPSAHVSRRHAGIACDEKGEFWVEDLRSSNGTYVNGRAVLKRRLRANDLVDVGPFSFRFVPAKAGDAPPSTEMDPNEETRAIRCVPGSLSGEIEKNGVVSVLALICSARRSGVLTLRAGPHVGRIFVIDGEVHHAQFGKAAGEAALAALLPAEGGFLHFSDERIKVNRTITRSTDEIFAG